MRAVRLPSQFDRPSGSGPVPTASCCCCCCCIATVATLGTLGGFTASQEAALAGRKRPFGAIILTTVAVVVGAGAFAAGVRESNTSQLPGAGVLLPAAIGWAVGFGAYVGLTLPAMRAAGAPPGRAWATVWRYGLLGFAALALEFVLFVYIVLFSFGPPPVA